MRVETQAMWKAVGVGAVMTLAFSGIGLVTQPFSQFADPAEVATATAVLSTVIGLLTYAAYMAIGVVYNGFALAEDVDLRPMEGLIGGGLTGMLVGLVNVAAGWGLIFITRSLTSLMDTFNSMGLTGGIIAMILVLGSLFNMVMIALLSGFGAAVAAGVGEYRRSDRVYG